MARCTLGPPCPSGDAHQARRDRAASAVATRVCVLHPSATTAPDPHLRTPPEAPLVDRGACIIRAFFPACVSFHTNVNEVVRTGFLSPSACGERVARRTRARERV